MRRATVVLALLGLLAATPGAAEDRVRVGLLPVQVHSNDADSSYLSQGFADMLSSRLEQSGEIAVVRVARAPTTDPGDAVEAGRAAGVQFVVFGSFTQFGEGASLDIQCAPVSAGAEQAGEEAQSDAAAERERRIFVSSGTLAEIIPKLDELADKLSRFLLGPPASTPAPAGSTVAAGAGAAPASDLDQLRQRIDALERAVFYGERESAAGPDAAKGASHAPDHSDTPHGRFSGSSLR